MEKVILKDLMGEKLEEDFLDFDLTEIQAVLKHLKQQDPIDLSHAELLQQQSLRALDIITEYVGKIVKTVSYLESRISTVKNRTSLEYTSPDGGKVTMEMRKFAGEASKEVEELQMKLAHAKGSKAYLDKKFSTLSSAHYFYKEITAGIRKTIVGYSPMKEKTPEGWE